jgi:diacylglycerol kinase (ATP)
MRIAIRGLASAVKTEPHMQVHLLAAFVVTNAGVYFSITRGEWFMVCTCIVLVMGLEIINTAIEKLCNVVMPDVHPVIKYVKDIMSGAVLIMCIFAVIAGVMVFWPYLLRHRQ